MHLWLHGARGECGQETSLEPDVVTWACDPSTWEAGDQYKFKASLGYTAT